MLRKKLKASLMFVFLMVLIFSGAYAQEQTSAVIFRDVEAQGENYWARSAIYRMAEMSVIKGNEHGLFEPFSPVTREEVFAFIYRAVGKEAEAQRLANEYWNRVVLNEPGNTNTRSWSDGYLIMAADDGLITRTEMEAALKTGYSGAFKKDEPAQRQEVAVWLAKVLKLEPVYSLQVCINSFSDGMEVDPLKRPYLEAILRENIMNGSGGCILPKNNILREQMAQILVNSEKYIHIIKNSAEKSIDELLKELDFSDVYRGRIYFYDPYTSKIVISDANKWENNVWVPAVGQAYMELELNHNALLFAEKQKITVNDINKNYLDSEAYFAVRKGEDGKNCVVLVSLGYEILKIQS